MQSKEKELKNSISVQDFCIDKKMLEEVTEFRRWMHTNPELSECEEKTAERICQILKKHNIFYEDNVGGHGVIAIVNGKNSVAEKSESRTVAAKADMDALPIEERSEFPLRSCKPGVMHACGHDANTAILLGTALYLKSQENNFGGSVKLFFEPAEETIGGGELMVNDGCMENPHVDKIIGLHVMPYLNVGTVEIKKGCLNAGTNEVEIIVHGTGGHAAEPDKCVDPIVTLAYIITALQTFVSRNTDPTQSAVLTFGIINGGTKGNIIPESAFIKGTMRTLLPQQREYAKARVREIAENVAKGFGAKAEVNITESYDPVINDDDIVDVVQSEASRLFGSEKVFQKEYPSMGAEDFSYYTKSAGGAYFHIGCKNPKEREIRNLHTDNFQIDERCIENGIAIQAAVLLRMLE